jgi:cell division septum initiation protein DivIVA
MKMRMNIPANETSREELLTRDVKILLDEVRQLRKERDELKNTLDNIREWVNRIGISNR